MVLILQLLEQAMAADTAKKRTYRRAFREDPENVFKRLRNQSSYEFRSVYRIQKSRFNFILEKLNMQTKVCRAGKIGHFAEVKLAACLRLLTTGEAPRTICHDYQMGASTLDGYFNEFLDDFLAVFKQKYLEEVDWAKVIRRNDEVHGVRLGLQVLH